MNRVLAIMLLGMVPLLFAAGSMATTDKIVDHNNVTLKFVTDAINASGQKLVSINQTNFDFEARFADKYGHVFRVSKFYDEQRIDVGMGLRLQDSFNGSVCDLYKAANEENDMANVWPHIAYYVGENGSYLIVKSGYDCDGQISQNDLASYFKDLPEFIAFPYESEPPFVHAYGEWSS